MYLQKSIPKRIRFRLNNIRLNVAVLGAYTVLSLIFTYPVAFSPNKIPGCGDAFWFLWIFWWFKTALFNLENPYYTYYIYHPTGVSLASSDISLINAVASIPLQVAFGLVGSYKIIWILSFILSGYGTFHLVKYLTIDTKAAFVSGLIFMFCPYHFAHAYGHINLISTQWIPLYVLFLIKGLNEKKRSNAYLAAILLLLNALSSYYYFIYISIFTVIYILYMCWSNDNFLNLNTIKNVGIITIVFIFIFSPFAYPVMKEMINSEYMYYTGFVEYSADVLGFFIPSIFHPIFKDFVAPIYSNFTSYAESTVFMGYTVILLSILAFIKMKNSHIKFWALSGVIFFVLSLGPILQISGIVELFIEGEYSTYVPLPYSILMKIPMFSLARVPSRWSVLLMLSLAVLAGYGLKYLFDCCTSRYTQSSIRTNVLFIIVSSLVLFEFLAIPYPMSSAEVPDFYYTIANDSDNYSIIEVPSISGPISDSRYMYYQSIHEKKLVNGYVSRVPSYVIMLFDSAPIISNLFKSSVDLQDIMIQNYSEAGRSLLDYYNIKYIIIHKDLMSSEQLDLIDEIFQTYVKDYNLIYESGSMIVYEIKKKPVILFMELKHGWYGVGNWNGKPTRWMSNNATIMIYSEENSTIDLSLRATSFSRPRTLGIYLNNHPYRWDEVSCEEFSMVNLSALSLNKGVNLIRLYTPEECERPYDIKTLNNPDRRCLSLAIQDIRISKKD